MNRETVGNRLSVTIYGKMSSGKSKIMNQVLGQEASIVSRERGTTTDPVSRPMELGSAGAVLLTDTAGIDDEGMLGQKRVARTIQTLEYTDLAIYVMDSEDIDERTYNEMVSQFKGQGVSHLLVFNKVDKVSSYELEPYRDKYPKALFISAKSQSDMTRLKMNIEEELSLYESEKGLLEGIISEGDMVLIVVSIDESYPRGRLILPQVEVIRDVLDRGGLSTVIRQDEFDLMDSLEQYSLVVVDSSIYGQVESRVPLNIPLTTFSILFSRKKGDLDYFVKSAKALDSLGHGSKVLICESCKHSKTHQDIARVKIPKAVDIYTHSEIIYEYNYGPDLSINMEEYDLIVHCGACMDKKSALKKRVTRAKSASTPMTNYGVLFAYISGNLGRTVNFL